MLRGSGVTQMTDFISELIEAANTLESVTPNERRRLIERGISTVRAQQELLQLQGNLVAIEPGLWSPCQLSPRWLGAKTELICLSERAC